MVDAKEYLSEIRTLKKDLRILREMRRNVHIAYDSMRGIDYSAERVKSSPKNALEEAAWRMLRNEESLMEREAQTAEELNRRLDMIRQMPNRQHASILFETYYNGRKVHDIAKSTGLKPGYVSNLKRKALSDFGERYKAVI